MSIHTALLGVVAEVDLGQVIVGTIATLGAIAAALANTKGRKQEAAVRKQEAITSNIEVNIEANNRLVDQLQETIDTQSDDNELLRKHIGRLDKRVAELETHLEKCHRERSGLAIDNHALRSKLAEFS